MTKLLVLVLCGSALAGCSASTQKPLLLISPSLGTPMPAPVRVSSNGLYHVAAISADAGSTPLPHTLVYLKKGSMLQFKRNDDGDTLLAIGGECVFEVKTTLDAKRVAWLAATAAAKAQRRDPVIRTPAERLPDRDELPGPREGLIEQLVTDPAAFGR